MYMCNGTVSCIGTTRGIGAVVCIGLSKGLWSVTGKGSYTGKVTGTEDGGTLKYQV